jgi:NADH:ubiquinone oxidoreductase subunit K
VSCPARIKTAIKLFMSAKVLLLAVGLDIVVATIVTFWKSGRIQMDGKWWILPTM